MTYLLAIIAADIALCVAVFETFRRTFDLSGWLLAIHLPLLLALYAGGLLLSSPVLFIRRLREHRLAPYSLVVAPSLITAALLFLYAANFASNSVIGENIIRPMIRLWMSDWWRRGAILGLSRWLALVPAGFALVSLAVHRAVARRGQGRLAESLRDTHASVRSPGIRPAVLAVAIAGAYAAFFYELSWRTPRSDLLTSDPLLALARTTLDVLDEKRERLVARVEKDDAVCRADYPRGIPFDRRNVIFITVDSLRADHTEMYGYHRQTTPFLSELFRSGKLRKIDFATATCAESNCGIISTLGSKTLPYIIPQNFKLYDLLRDQGYDTHLILSGNHDFRGLRELYGTGHTTYFEGRESKRYVAFDDRALLEGLERVADARTPAFFYFHLMSPHVLGHKQPEFRVFKPFEVTNNLDALLRGEYQREPIVNAYDNGLLQADSIIKQLFAELDRKGYLRNSLTVILGDHGEALGDRGPRQYGHVTSLYQELIRIPMLIYDQSPAQYRLDFATQIDIAPTIVDRMGLPVPDCWQGDSLLRPATTSITRHQTTLTRPCYAVIDRSGGRLYKFMACGEGRRQALYDLTADPGERTNLVRTADPALLARMRKLYQERPD